MRQTIILPAIAVTVLSLLDFAVSPSRPLIKEIKQLRRGADSLTGRGTTKFFYNANGTISKLENSNGVTSVYLYQPTVIYRKTNDPRTKKEFTDTFLLNKSGLVSERRLSGQSIVKGRYLYEYDEAGYVKSIRSAVGLPAEGVMIYSYKDSTQVSITQRYKNDPRVIQAISTYTDKDNTIGNANMGMAFDGQSSKKLVGKASQVFVGKDTSRSEYRYHFDMQGRVSIKVSYYNGNLGDSTAYTYY